VKKILGKLRQELKVCRLVWQDKRTPRAAKWLLGLALGYALSPIDLIPDFIPVLGYLDDLIIVPLLVWLAFRLVSKEVIVDCRRRAVEEKNKK